VCGICGKLSFDRDAALAPALLKTMADTIEHRGPDDEGYYISGPVGFGFRRLSIIDLDTGHQPISNEDGTIWIVFNGEIYNYRELRRTLESKGHAFRTQTDTEVIVHLYEEFGEACLEKLRGMFAFAVWDERRQTLLLARDRVGIKPLYYSLTGQSIVFGSEIKAILADPEVKAEVVPEMIDRFLTFFYVPGEETLFRNIHKLAPGYCLTVKNGTVTTRQYWDLQFEPTARSTKEAEEELLALLEESVRLHMISDVPVGFLLSGGVDSTAMLSLAAGKTEQRISSYTIGFSSPGVIDERPYARLAAERFAADPHELTITAKEFADFLPKFAWHMEEPVCDPHAVALYFVSKLARDFVKVLISGEGGDEAFGGYQTYRGIQWLERAKKLLGPLTGLFASGLTRMNGSLASDRIGKYAPLFSLAFEDYYYSRTSNPFTYFNSASHEFYSKDFAFAANKGVSLEAVKKYMESGNGYGVLNRMLYIDTKTSLPDDLLLKADKMTMANSIELRVPLLDHKVLEFAASLPEKLKVRNFTTKYIVKSAFRDRIPREILNRPKAGFPVPYAQWLRTELKDWLRDVLLDRETISRGYFNRSEVEKLVSEHSVSGRFSKEVFSLVALELWHRTFLPSSSPVASENDGDLAMSALPN
jgi:asparagine synthase (glutamine-hydrolysing)